MRSFFVFLLTFVLICASIFVLLVILMQRPSANAGMGASLGGGAAESAFGGDTTKVLTKWTISGIITFFVVAFSLSMMYIYSNSHKQTQFDNIHIENVVDGSAGK